MRPATMPLDRARVEAGETDTALPTHSGQRWAEPDTDTGQFSEFQGRPLLSSMLYCWPHRRQRNWLRDHRVGDRTREKKRSLGPGWGVQKEPPSTGLHWVGIFK